MVLYAVAHPYSDIAHAQRADCLGDLGFFPERDQALLQFGPVRMETAYTRRKP
ncbi:hypothetical protein EDD99_3625 [Streptomyces sp. 846.5]|nr:hypothetical protein [Streptomyces sp. 846.5]TDU05127.1 hypothetical protein EDD99_3625 [Streptomyces sp. 846.5]